MRHDHARPAASGAAGREFPGVAVRFSSRSRRPVVGALGALGAVTLVASLAACGGAGSGGSGGSGGGSGAKASSPVAVSEADYQTALTAVDTALTAPFTQLRGARTPKAVADAASKAADAANAQLTTLRNLVPPAPAASGHETFVTGLDALAKELDGAKSDGDGAKLCAGSAASSQVGRSDGATQVRTAAATLAKADPAHPYTVGKFLPASSPEANRRLANGALIKGAKGGEGKLQVTNGGSTDAVVTLVKVKATAATLKIYVRGNATANATRIPDGSYDILISFGDDWDPALRLFTRSCSFEKFDTTTDYRTTASTYSNYRITLTPVAGGNASTSEVDPGSIPAA